MDARVLAAVLTIALVAAHPVLVGASGLDFVWGQMPPYDEVKPLGDQDELVPGGRYMVVFSVKVKRWKAVEDDQDVLKKVEDHFYKEKGQLEEQGFKVLYAEYKYLYKESGCVGFCEWYHYKAKIVVEYAPFLSAAPNVTATMGWQAVVVAFLIGVILGVVLDDVVPVAAEKVGQLILKAVDALGDAVASDAGALALTITTLAVVGAITLTVIRRR